MGKIFMTEREADVASQKMDDDDDKPHDSPVVPKLKT